MHIFLIWCDFLGSWLLVAGSIYQSALELKDEDIEQDRIRAAGEKIGPQPHASAWWWLIPPVKIILERRNDKAYRKKYFMAMTSEDAEAMVSFVNKATAWIFVAGGGFLIALEETSEVIYPRHTLGIIGYITLVIVLLAASLLHTILRIKRSNNIIEINKQSDVQEN